MSVIGKKIESIIEAGFRYIKLATFGNSDNSKVFRLNPFGEDSNPPEGYKALLVNTNNSEDPVCVGFINEVVLDDLNSGEKQIFSTNSAGDTIQAFIKLLNDGKIQFNGNADFIAGFNDLKSGFDTLKDDVNSLISDYNTHTHVTTATVSTGSPGAIAPTTATGTPTTASIDSSKKDNLLTE